MHAGKAIHVVQRGASPLRMDRISDILGPDGLLAHRLPGFAVRSQQLEMAEAVQRAIEGTRVLICEAGTGTGKTFAYLVPALLAGRKVIVSTGTRNLQDQLFHRDLPLVRKVLASALRPALLKGRSNYLCLQRLEAAVESGRVPAVQLGQLVKVQEWAGRTRQGDIAESGLPEGDPIWSWATSTTDNCLGQDCPHWDRCHLVEARRRAQEADLVVINHHLLCADLALREEGCGEILPGADCFILDEAHQLPEVASSFFGSTLSARQLMELARDVEVEYQRGAGDAPQVPEQAEHLKRAVRELRLSLGVEARRSPLWLVPLCSPWASSWRSWKNSCAYWKVEARDSTNAVPAAWTTRLSWRPWVALPSRTRSAGTRPCGRASA
jgi:ATP-dependent DNA helicase DinG